MSLTYVHVHFQLTDVLIEELGEGNFDIVDVTFRYYDICNFNEICFLIYESNSSRQINEVNMT